MTKLVISYVMLSYQHADYVDEAIRSAFSQDLEPDEYIISDDSSSDGTFAVLSAAVTKYSRPGQSVKLLRTPHNLGLCGNLHFAMGHVRGDVIVFHSADDVARAERVRKVAEAFSENQNAMMVMSNARVIGAGGDLLRERYAPLGTRYSADPIQLAQGGFPWLVGATEAIRREVYFEFGPISRPGSFEDFVFAFRAALLGRLFFIDAVLLDWRHHGANMSHFTDFESDGALEAFRLHFLKTLKAKETCIRQHLIDLETFRENAGMSGLFALKQLLMSQLAEKRMELSARSGMPWPNFWARFASAKKAGLPMKWLIRQMLIRLCTDQYFRLVFARLRHAFSKLEDNSITS